MFLVDSAEAGMDWDGVIASITKILDKVKAEIVSIRKWDDRRLAYDIRRVSRGTYILTYFRVEGQNIQEIEKSVQLSERIIRVLILNAEGMSAADIEKETPAARAEKEGFHESQEPDSEPRYRDRDRDRDDRSDEPRRGPAAPEDDLPEPDEVEMDDEQESRPRTMADD
jgi:small subunit ribosomal protein S6